MTLFSCEISLFSDGWSRWLEQIQVNNKASPADRPIGGSKRPRAGHRNTAYSDRCRRRFHAPEKPRSRLSRYATVYAQGDCSFAAGEGEAAVMTAFVHAPRSPCRAGRKPNRRAAEQGLRACCAGTRPVRRHLFNPKHPPCSGRGDNRIEIETSRRAVLAFMTCCNSPCSVVPVPDQDRLWFRSRAGRGHTADLMLQHVE